jgi:predicted regulator of Ras-like GTPase activity (Roadblock/LC7/MglB family)
VSATDGGKTQKGGKTMKVPVGHKLKDLEVTEPRVEILIEEAQKGNLTGYLRITYERENVNDFYIFFINGELTAIYGEEMLTEKEMSGKDALDYALTIFSKGIASLYQLQLKEIEDLTREEPDICLEEKELGFTELLEAQLKRLNIEGQFLASLLADVKGLPIAAMDSEYNTEMIAALSALVRDVSHRAETQLGFKKTDEVSLVDDDKLRLVCRYFQVGNQTYILSCVIPAYQTYRRLTNSAIKEIVKIMEKKFHNV